MHAEEALGLLDEILPINLNNLQEIIFCQVWEGKTYAEIANEYNYEHSYIRDIGFRLWRQMSESLQQKVSKTNVKAVLSRYARHHQAALSIFPALPIAPPSEPEIIENIAIGHDSEFEFPNGPVPLNSRFYIERPPIEKITFREVLKPGSLLRLKGPRQMGKTSLLRRILNHAKFHQIQVVTLNFHRADQSVFLNLNQFLRWICANISYQLELPAKLDDYWNADIGSKVSCTIYLEEYILKQCSMPIVIALDEINELFQFPELSSDFLPLLRSWYEDSKEIESWRRLRWILSHATDVYVPLQLNQSPFNVGLPISLPEFTLQQIQCLAARHGLETLQGETGIQQLLPLLDIISCRPGLVRLALFHLSQEGGSLGELIAQAHTQSSIYRDHLRHLLAAIYPYQDLQDALKHIIYSHSPVELSPVLAYRLESIGLIKLEGNLATISCGLYKRFFSQYLPKS